MPWMPFAEQGKYLYANTPSGSVVIQTSGNSRPRVVATIPTRVNVVSGDYAYGADGNAISVIDISKPNKPVVLSKTTFAGARILAVYGDYGCYTGGYSDSLVVVDFADRRHPRARGGLRTTTRIVDVEMFGHFVYVAQSDNYDVAVMAVDVSNPDAPLSVVTFGDVFPVGLAMSGSTLAVLSYYPDHGNSLVLYDVTNGSPRYLSYVPSPYCLIRDFSISGQYAYLVSAPSIGCGEGFDPPVTAVVRLTDKSIIAQHGDVWYGMAALSKIYVPRYDLNGSMTTVDVFPLQCEQPAATSHGIDTRKARQ